MEDNNTIGTYAGIVWNILHNNNKAWEISELKKATELKDIQLWTAIGWLAREDKITLSIEKKGKKEVQLCALTPEI